MLHAGLNQGLKILAYPVNESGVYVAIHHNLDVPLMGVKRKFIPLGSENNAKVKIEAVKDHGGSWCFDNEEDKNGKPKNLGKYRVLKYFRFLRYQLCHSSFFSTFQNKIIIYSVHSSCRQFIMHEKYKHLIVNGFTL